MQSHAVTAIKMLTANINANFTAVQITLKYVGFFIVYQVASAALTHVLVAVQT